MSDLQIRIFDGTRQPFAAPASFRVVITDGRGQLHLDRNFPQATILVTGLPSFDGGVDGKYSVVITAQGYQDVGYQPVLVSDRVLTTLDLMLISNNPGFSFVNARWPAAKQAYPFLSLATEDPVAAQRRYEDLLEAELPLACFLNIVEAMSQIVLPQQTPLDYLKLVYWEGTYANAAPPAQDRFYAWCDKGLVDQVRQATQAGIFVPAPYSLHPGATNSWKQVNFGEANVQLTFHEHAVHPEHPDWIIVEPDIDYFRNSANHVFLEVLPNIVTHHLTDPIMVYVLRWIAGQTLQTPEFDPLYTVT